MESTVRNALFASGNIVNALGFSTTEVVEAMWRGESGIRLQDDRTIYPEPFMAANVDWNKFRERAGQYRLESYAPFEQIVIYSILDALNGSVIEPADEKTLLILSTTKGNIDFLNSSDMTKEALKEKSRQRFMEAFLWKSAQNIAGYFQMRNEPLVVSNACVSGVAAVEAGARLLREDRYENIIVAGADLITAFTVSGFQSFKSISSQPCKPYDIGRDGLSIGEGAATIILTNKEENIGNGHRICILGGATANDANHISGPSRTGDGLHYAIENALKQSGITKSAIDFMNLHGTATLFNDEMESKAIALSGLSDVPAGSFKGYFGHTLGASGIMEIVACIESLKQNRLFGTLGFSALGVPEKMNIVAKNTSTTLHTFLKTASGFGGFNSAIVVSDNLCDWKPTGRPVLGKTLVGYRIHNNRIEADGCLLFEYPEAEDIGDFLKQAFKNLNAPNMKFYKMDNLSKLGYLTVQYLLRDNDLLAAYNKKNVALVFGNTASSLDTDINHQLTIRDKEPYFPSPAVFVYTLPNIVLGEICIKEKIQGETMFFVTERFDKDFLNQYADILLASTETEVVLVGQLECLGREYYAEAWIRKKRSSLKATTALLDRADDLCYIS